MKTMLRNGSAILFAAALAIFVVSFFGSIFMIDGLTNDMPGSGPSRGITLLDSLASALSNSVWAFGLACIVDRLDRHWGKGK